MTEGYDPLILTDRDVYLTLQLVSINTMSSLVPHIHNSFGDATYRAPERHIHAS